MIYGGTHALLHDLLPNYGITATLVPPQDVEAFAAAITPATKVLFVETIGNPTLAIADIAVLAELARSRGVKLVVDNIYPGLPSHPQHGLFKAMANEGYGFGGMLEIDCGTLERANQLLGILQNEEEFGLVAVSLGFRPKDTPSAGRLGKASLPTKGRQFMCRSGQTLGGVLQWMFQRFVLLRKRVRLPGARRFKLPGPVTVDDPARKARLRVNDGLG